MSESEIEGREKVSNKRDVNLNGLITFEKED